MERIKGSAMQETQKSEIFTSGLIHMLSNKMKRHNASWEEGDGLTPIQKHVLKFVLFETMNREVYQKDIEEEFQIRKSTATGILQLLEKNGFISREYNEQDARFKRIVPTSKSEAMHFSILEDIRKREKLLLKNCSKEQVEVCRTVLFQMLDNLAQGEKEDKEEHKKHE